MKNRIKDLFENQGSEILNVYFTAGFPKLNSTIPIIEYLSQAGVEIIEIGMPYSDPLADGLTIQQSSSQALKNGMHLNLLFEQIELARKKVDTALIMMGYLNQLMQYGVEAFIRKASNIGIDAMIIPDMPMEIYEKEYKPLFEKYAMGISFLITPQTSPERIIQADRLSTAFIYMVSQSSITGVTGQLSENQIQYFERVAAMNLKNPRLIGFGIHDHQTYQLAMSYAHGAIIGSAFIRAVSNADSIEEAINRFIQNIRK